MNGQPTYLTALGLRKTDTNIAEIGGLIAKFTAGATLLIGDVVYVSGSDTVNKSTTNADYQKFAGVVVGGQTYSANEDVLSTLDEVGGTAATVDQWVLVQYAGIAPYKSDGAITAGARIIPDASVAGECDVAGANPGVTLGTAVTAAADGAVGKFLIRPLYDEA